MRKTARYEEQDSQPPVQVRREGMGTAITWLLVGLGIGAGVALLLTPSTGRELRSAVARGYRAALEGVSRGTQELRRRRSNLLNFKRRHSGQKLG